ncbi:sigma-70 family RNA polymerase sigma factor [Streptomyces sp. SS1-1]|uniref:RNA polymerase sigma factor n=1 Tax=Streptomyces sp. KAU_LT TaxID=3046669 RepID=UPI00124FAE94|nr:MULTISPECIES: sigma-70 family RNA polymerase sigma factor [unclassified Streptomyces]KAB2972772.1 sigma-70 family RNA polymerase sigma factor [Streptomyces sp. SS1-1]MDI9834802.1 sigma-70 family RNA polymerase sigma factor [Streptomyces sp. KAU_LT]
MLRRKARRGQGGGAVRDTDVLDDPLDAAQERRVRAVLALGGVPQADLPDGVQQVRLRLLERAAGGHEAPRDVSAWAAVVASNLAMDWHRARKRQERLGERLAALRQPVAHPSGEETSLLSLAVARGLDELPDILRQVVVLRFFADLPVRGIAEELGIPEGTVKSRLHTAVRALRARLHEDEVV